MQNTHLSKQTLLFISAGIAALIIVHGLGRFAFIPLFPYLVQDHIIDLHQGAFLATLNYTGYLIGALMAIFLTHPKYLKKVLLSGLIVSLLSTVLQVFITDFDFFAILRFFNGLSNGWVFVLAPALLLEWLVEHQRTKFSGYIYFGVSIGLILSSVLVDWLAHIFSGQMRWLPVAVFAFPLTIFAIFFLNKIQIKPPEQTESTTKKLLDTRTTPLLIAYAGAGLGYILPMTFLPTLAHELVPHLPIIVSSVWLFVAIACLFGLPFWNWLGFRFNDRFALLLSYIVQIFGILALLLFPNAIGILLCAILIGFSFMGTILCSQRLAKYFQPHQGAKLFATLIAIYAGTQLIGPYLSQIYMQHGGSLLNSFIFGLIALIWGFLWTLKIPKNKLEQINY